MAKLADPFLSSMDGLRRAFRRGEQLPATITASCHGLWLKRSCCAVWLYSLSTAPGGFNSPLSGRKTGSEAAKAEQ